MSLSSHYVQGSWCWQSSLSSYNGQYSLPLLATTRSCVSQTCLRGVLSLKYPLAVTEVYPLLVAALLVGVITEAGRNMLEAWIQRVRDREFLVDTRVRNLEEAEAQAEAIAQPDAQPPVEA